MVCVFIYIYIYIYICKEIDELDAVKKLYTVKILKTLKCYIMDIYLLLASFCILFKSWLAIAIKVLLSDIRRSSSKP